MNVVTSWFTLGPVSAYVGDRLWPGKPPQRGTRHPGLYSAWACLCAGWNEYLAKSWESKHACREIHQPVSVVSQCGADVWL